jgi:hypothetical protein
MLNKLKRKVCSASAGVCDMFHRHWAAATLVAVFVAWCVAVHSRMSL